MATNGKGTTVSFSFTPSTDPAADAGAIAAYQSRLAKLAPSCVRCGHKLGKTELAGRTCRDREVCRIRRAGGSVAGFATLRKFRRDHPEQLRPSTAPAEAEIALAESASSTVAELRAADTRSTTPTETPTDTDTNTDVTEPTEPSEPTHEPTQRLEPSTVKASTSEPSDAWSVEEEAPAASPAEEPADSEPAAVSPPVEPPTAPAAPAPARGYAVRHTAPARVHRGAAVLRQLRCA